ncbi:hypothetical protein Trydic_g5566 [Trypoxylus dichotomus]
MYAFTALKEYVCIFTKIPAMKFLLILINLCAFFGSWVELLPVIGSNKNDLKEISVEPENPNTNNYYNFELQPVLLVKVYKQKHTSEFLIPLQNTWKNNDVYSDNDQKNINNYHRSVRSTYAIEIPEVNNASYDDDLSLAESSIPFHPLFSVRHRKEFKRRYYSRRGRI